MARRVDMGPEGFGLSRRFPPAWFSNAPQQAMQKVMSGHPFMQNSTLKDQEDRQVQSIFSDFGKSTTKTAPLNL